VKNKFRTLFDGIPPVKHTCIIDSLDVAEKVFKQYKGTKRTIIIFSDMMEDSSYADFDFPALQIPQIPTAKVVIERIRNERELPDIKGAEVIIIGARATTSDLHRKIEKFWREFFRELGAKITAYNYGLIDCL
jgi:cobalamin biosynthesis Co2+ chelatase CbiK